MAKTNRFRLVEHFHNLDDLERVTTVPELAADLGIPKESVSKIFIRTPCVTRGPSQGDRLEPTYTTAFDPRKDGTELCLRGHCKSAGPDCCRFMDARTKHGR